MGLQYKLWGVYTVQATAGRLECGGEMRCAWVNSRIQVTVLGGRTSRGHTPDTGCVEAEQVVQPILHRITRGVADWLRK